MPKATELLEKHVQWIVLGIAVLFLALTVYLYWLQPMTVTVNGQEQPPEDVIKKIRSDIENVKATLSNPVDPVTVPDRIASFTNELKFSPAEQFASVFEPLVPSNFMTDRGGDVKDIQVPVRGDLKIAELPQLPAPKDVQTSQQRLVAMVPAKPIPVQPVVNQQQPPAAPAAPPAPDVQKDVDVVTVSGFIPKELAAVWNATIQGNAPASFYKTRIMRIELIREEQDRDGKWTNQTVVTPLKTHEVPPLPKDDAPLSDKNSFREWVILNSSFVTNPAFYQTVGTPYKMPTAPAVQPVGSPQPFSGKSEAAPRPQHLRNALFTPSSRSNVSFAGRFRNEGADEQDFEDQDDRFRGRGQFNPGQPNQQQAAGVGDIDLKQMPKDIQVWQHDETVKPGHTYRYKMRYYIENPLATSNLPPEKSGKFLLRSVDSPWTNPVNITDRVNFWVASVNDNRADFEVFVWANGAWSRATRSGRPGDLIQDTSFSIVDLRRAAGGTQYALVMNNQTGETREHFAKVDMNDPLYQQLRNEVPKPGQVVPGGQPPAQGGPVSGGSGFRNGKL